MIRREILTYPRTIPLAAREIGAIIASAVAANLFLSGWRSNDIALSG
jgi:hypothetical protein